VSPWRAYPTRALASMLVAQQFETLGWRLAPFDRNPEVAAFLGVLHDELRERRWLTQWLPATIDQPSAGAS
jgi:hypothetical protein